MQFALHATRRTPHGASRLVQAMYAWLVKTRRDPHARVYGHTTTAMPKLSTPPPRLPSHCCVQPTMNANTVLLMSEEGANEADADTVR